MTIRNFKVRKKITLPIIGELEFGIYIRLTAKIFTLGDESEKLSHRCFDVFINQRKIIKLREK